MMNDIIFDKDYTYNYRDKYNRQCTCTQCVLFRNHFPTQYPQLVAFLSQYGVHIDFPLEIMDNGTDSTTLKRSYSVYYAVKGHLPKDKIHTLLNTIDITMRNAIISKEAYANTDMQPPFFIIECCNICLYDNQGVFKDALDAGREIEFSYNGQLFFASRNSATDWYIYCEESKETQRFSSTQALLQNTLLQSTPLNTLWDKISLDYIL